MLEFQRTVDGQIHIQYNSLEYVDIASNLELDSAAAYDDTLTVEYQRWSEGKRCIIDNGNQQSPPPSYDSMIDTVLANLQDIVDAKTDRLALANPEVQLTLNPTSILADGAATTTLTVQLVSGLKNDATRQNIAQAGVGITVRVIEPNGVQEFNYVTNANGQAVDTYDAVEAGTYTFESITHPSVTAPQLTAT